MKIFKYNLNFLSDSIVRLPSVFTILSVQSQGIGSDVSMWVTCDPDSEIHDRKFFGLATGDDLPEGITWNEYLGTVVLYGGKFVCHYFDGGPMTYGDEQ
jgi:hypothetical protein